MLIRISKKILKFVFYFLLFFIAFVLVYILSAFCLSRITVSKELNEPAEVAIYIKTNGVHTDIVVPVKNEQFDWSKEIRFSNTYVTDSTGFQYLSVGWGDKGFYLETPEWSDLKAGVAFRAAFALSTTAIHATFYRDLKENRSCKKIMISREQYARLISYISNSFQHDDASHVIKINTSANYGDTDAFYEAKGKYSLFHTCNSWANAGLKSCGQKACLWTAFDTGIFLKYE